MDGNRLVARHTSQRFPQDRITKRSHVREQSILARTHFEFALVEVSE